MFKGSRDFPQRLTAAVTKEHNNGSISDHHSSDTNTPRETPCPLTTDHHHMNTTVDFIYDADRCVPISDQTKTQAAHSSISFIRKKRNT